MNQYRNLIEALEAAPAERAFVTAWIDEDERQSVNFGEFRRRARLQAKLLHEHGTGVGDRVIVVMPQGISAMTAFVGAMMLGAVPALLAYPNFKVEPSKYRAGLAGVTANLKARIVLIDHDFPEEMLGYVSLDGQATLIRISDSIAPGGEDFELPLLGHGGQSLAFIQHSAGTTGLQKGVALSHTAVLRQLEHVSDALKIDAATDSVYSWLPLYHDMGLIACFMLPMVCHLPLVMQSPLDWVMHPESILQIVGEYRCTLSWMPNFAFQFIARRTPREKAAKYDLSSMRAFINCSEQVRPESMDEFHNAFYSIGLKSNALQSCYAMAENVFAVTQSDPSQPSGPPRVSANAARFRKEQLIAQVAEEEIGAVLFQSSGRLLPGHELRIMSDSGKFLGDAHVGEILIKSDNLFEGYFNRPDLTAKAIVDGWYHSGDLGFTLERELFVVGRKKDLLIVGGENFYPQDLEEIVGSHPAIHDGRVVAIGVYNPDLGTDSIVIVAEVDKLEHLANAEEIERDLRNLVVAGTGIAVSTIFLKPPKWIVKSTAGKAARAATREKLLQEHSKIDPESREGPTT